MLVSTNQFIAHAEDIHGQMEEEPHLELFHDTNHPLGDYGQCEVCRLFCHNQPLYGLADDESIHSQYCYHCMLQIDYYLTQLKETGELADQPDSYDVLRADYNRQQVR